MLFSMLLVKNDNNVHISIYGGPQACKGSLAPPRGQGRSLALPSFGNVVKCFCVASVVLNFSKTKYLF